MFISISAQNNWKIHKMHVKSAFLNGNLEEELYVEQPTGYVVNGREDKVYRLKKSLYDLKHALRVWYKKIDSYFVHNDFQSVCLSTRYILNSSSLEMFLLFACMFMI